jgi:hypothetical protein
MARHTFRFACLIVLGVLISRGTAIAGPPLLCHPFDIGTARSQPWDGARGWAEGNPDYDVKNLVRDTEGLLTPSTPVIVRMETLRRAALYASRDGAVAKELLSTLNARARNSMPDISPKPSGRSPCSRVNASSAPSRERSAVRSTTPTATRW